MTAQEPHSYCKTMNNVLVCNKFFIISANFKPNEFTDGMINFLEGFIQAIGAGRLGSVDVQNLGMQFTYVYTMDNF